MAKRREVGEKAPPFKAPVAGGGHKPGTEVSLDDFAGTKRVVLYFYPKDDTPGCTKQACGLRDDWEKIRRKAAVFGVSIDSVAKHDKFIEKYDLPFPLISDEDHALVKAYGVWVEKNLYGRKYMGTERTTFVIGKDGNIEAVLPKVKPAAHLEQLLEALA